MQATCNGWQKRAQQMYSSELTEVSVPAGDGSQQSSTFTRVHHGPVPKYHSQAYTKHKQKIRHNNKNSTHSPNSCTKIYQQENKFQKQQNNLKQANNPLHYLLS
jgi:hypothetical protein